MTGVFALIRSVVESEHRLEECERQAKAKAAKVEKQIAEDRDRLLDLFDEITDVHPLDELRKK